VEDGSQQGWFEHEGIIILIVSMTVPLLMLPFVNTRNKMLTSIVLNTGLQVPVQKYLMPPMTNLVGAIFQTFFGIETSMTMGSCFSMIARAGTRIEFPSIVEPETVLQLTTVAPLIPATVY